MLNKLLFYFYFYLWRSGFSIVCFLHLLFRAAARWLPDINALFYLVRNHGISQEVIDNAVEAGKQFFALPEEEKMKVCCVQ